MKQQVIPIGSKILIKQLAVKETYGNSGIYIPEAQQSKENKGHVVAIGEEVEEINIGDLIQYAKFADPVEMEHEGEKHLLIRKGDILAVIIDV